MPMFEVTNKKIELTEHQLTDLEAGIAAFLRGNTCTWESSIDPDNGILSFAARSSEQLPLDLTLLLGEMITNLRSVLDLAASELISIDCKTDDIRMIFPTAAKQTDYVTLCRNIKTRRDDSKAFFMNLAVYPEGAGKVLYGLDQLDSASKHTVLTPVIGVAKIGPVKITNDSAPSTVASMECSMDMDGCTRLMGLKVGTSAEVDNNAKPTFDLYFGDVGQFKFQKIVPTLKTLASAVKDTARHIEKFVITRF
jgi:hypothetical protein